MANMKIASKRKKTNTAVIIFISIAVILLLSLIISNVTSRTSYLKEVKVVKAQIAETSEDDGKYYLRVSLKDTNVSGYTESGNLWVEVKNDFYAAHNTGNEVGILLGNYDIYKKKGAYGKTSQSFEKNEWGVEAVFDSYESAMNAYPYSKTNNKAAVTKKKTTQKGDNFLVLEYSGRSFIYKTEKSDFDNYNVGQQVDCEFESVGEFMKLVSVLKQ